MDSRFIVRVLLAGVLFCSACNEEDAIVPKEVKEEIRFEFPQGTNAWDAIAVEIQEKFDVYIIYKGFDSTDINRNWTATGGVKYTGNPLSDEQASYTLNFVKKHLFDYLDSKVFKSLLPVYFYLVYDGKKNGTAFTEFFEGKDFWMYSLLSASQGELKTENEYRIFRGRFLYYMFSRIMALGKMRIPSEFNEGFDYKTAINAYSESDANYWKKRGVLSVSDYSWAPFSITYPYSSNMNSEVNFCAYIALCLRYTAEEYEKEFPKSKYPFMAKKRVWMMNYLKATLNFDAQKVAEGLEI